MPASTLRIAIAVFLIAHGLIYYSLTTVPLPVPGKIHTPFWPSWARDAVDGDWLAVRLGLAPAAVRLIGLLLVLAATIGFVLVGLGILGVPGLSAVWQPIALAAAVVSLVLFLFFWHPWLFMGVAINVGVLAALWQSWPAVLFAAQ